MRRAVCAILLCLWAAGLPADTWWVGFRDKQGSRGMLTSPDHLLTSRAIERRQRQGIELDSADLPVSTSYTDSLRGLGCRVLYTSRWLNGAVVSNGDTAFDKRAIRLPFVCEVQRTRRDSLHLSAAPQRRQKQPEPSTTANTACPDQFRLHRLQQLHAAGFRGQGMRIAVIDNGFLGVDTAPVFRDRRQQIVHTTDLVELGGNVYKHGQAQHGSKVLALLLAGDTTGHQAVAPEAEYLLFRTEDDASESLLEADNMVRAMEMADSLGADIISASLGYFEFDDPAGNFTYEQLDGRTARCSQAASIAAGRGMLVCIAAGNEAQRTWHYIDAPADAEGILAVGAVTADSVRSSFSSFGPTADGRIKPDVCALGSRVSICFPRAVSTGNNGTSYACPIMAGAAASLWSAMPELGSSELRDRLIRYASHTDRPDNETGYGLPDVWAAYSDSKESALTDAEERGGEKKVAEVWSLQGVRLRETPQRGMSIVRYEDGTTAKIIR